MRSIRRPSAPMIVSFAAVFIALGGSSYAAAKLTGADIANHSITGADVKNRSLGAKQLKPDSLGGNQINEAALGTVPSADTLDGIDSTGYMKTKPRLFETTAPGVDDFVSGSTLATLPSVPAGEYLVSARLTYKNQGPFGDEETCTLDVPGANDTSTFRPIYGDTVMLQKAVSAGAQFDASVSCTGDGNDDILGKTSIIAVRVD